MSPDSCKLRLITKLTTLSSLVFADLSSPAVKILFDGGLVIGEGFDAREIHYREQDDKLIFETRNNNTKAIIEYMFLKKKDAKKQSFAVENFPYASDYNPNEPNTEFCLENTSENLRDLIESCRYQIRLRDLTEEERKQLQKLKSKSPPGTPFKMIYDRAEIRTQSIGDSNLFVSNFLDTLTNASTILITNDNDQNGQRRMMWLKSDLTGRSFVIEGQLPTSGDCKDADPSDLKPTLCSGDVRIRPMNENDKPN